MKKFLSILAIILVCALAVAAFAGIFRFEKDSTDSSDNIQKFADQWCINFSDVNDFGIVDFDVDFISNGEKFVRIYAEDTNDEEGDWRGCLYYVREDGTTIQVSDYWNLLEPVYQYIFIERNADLPDGFSAWLEKYATHLGAANESDALKKMITFNFTSDICLCAEYEFICPEGMTWGEFFESEYCDSERVRLIEFGDYGMSFEINCVGGLEGEEVEGFFELRLDGISSTTVIESKGYQCSE